MGSIGHCLKSFLRAVVLLALTLFVALPDSGSTVPDLVSNAWAAEISGISDVSVDDGHEHNKLEVIFRHCDDGLDRSLLRATRSDEICDA